MVTPRSSCLQARDDLSLNGLCSVYIETVNVISNADLYATQLRLHIIGQCAALMREPKQLVKFISYGYIFKSCMSLAILLLAI